MTLSFVVKLKVWLVLGGCFHLLHSSGSIRSSNKPECFKNKRGLSV